MTVSSRRAAADEHQSASAANHPRHVADALGQLLERDHGVRGEQRGPVAVTSEVGEGEIRDALDLRHRRHGVTSLEDEDRPVKLDTEPVTDLRHVCGWQRGP